MSAASPYLPVNASTYVAKRSALPKRLCLQAAASCSASVSLRAWASQQLTLEMSTHPLIQSGLRTTAELDAEQSNMPLGPQTRRRQTKMAVVGTRDTLFFIFGEIDRFPFTPSIREAWCEGLYIRCCRIPKDEGGRAILPWSHKEKASAFLMNGSNDPSEKVAQRFDPLLR